MIVPGDPREGGSGNVVPLRAPSHADLLQAAAIMHAQGRFAEATQTGANTQADFDRAVQQMRYRNIEDRRKNAPPDEKDYRSIERNGRDIRGG